MKKVLCVLVLLSIGSVSFADSWSVDGKTFQSKAMAIRYVIGSGKRLNVTETRCMVVTNKFTLKACPKGLGNFDNQQFESLSVRE